MFSRIEQTRTLNLSHHRRWRGRPVRIATVRTTEGTAAVRIDPDAAVEVGAPDVGELLERERWAQTAAAADGARHALEALDYAPLVVRPEKIICVGLNYRHHILEMGRELPDYPTLFAKYTSALIGARDDIVIPAVSSQVDWEAELTIVIGASARHVSPEDAPGAIAGYTVLNDVSVRDYQNRTLQWLQGKTFESSTPVGPELVTRDDEALRGDGFDIECEVDGELVQKANTADLVFGPAALVSYISDITTLRPGDIIATGTPGGVGHARKPPRYLEDGNVVVTRIEGVGELRNVCRPEHLARRS
jgi:acylpyruvate hydrolase